MVKQVDPDRVASDPRSGEPAKAAQGTFGTDDRSAPGISRQDPPAIEIVHDAILVPPMIPRIGAYDGGVYDAARRPVALALHKGGRKRNIPTEDISTVVAKPMAGTWLFGGWLRRHFGHFIEESLGRLWALGDQPRPVDGVVFQLWGGWYDNTDEHARAVSGLGFVREAFQLLGVTVPIRVALEPLAFKTLIVPQQLRLHADPSTERTTWPTQKAYLRSMLERAPAGLDPPSDRIYVSRRKLGFDMSHFILEDVLEDNLRRSGYKIIYPETLTLAQQTIFYAGARKMIFAEGSALHFAAPFCGPLTEIVILARRGNLRAKFLNQLKLMGCARVHHIAEIAGAVSPIAGDRRRIAGVAKNAPDILLDFQLLGERLAALGFIDISEWRVPPPSEVRDAIRATIVTKAQQLDGVAHRFVEEPISDSIGFDRALIERKKARRERAASLA